MYDWKKGVGKKFFPGTNPKVTRTEARLNLYIGLLPNQEIKSSFPLINYTNKIQHYICVNVLFSNKNMYTLY